MKRIFLFIKKFDKSKLDRGIAIVTFIILLIFFFTGKESIPDLINSKPQSDIIATPENKQIITEVTNTFISFPLQTQVIIINTPSETPTLIQEMLPITTNTPSTDIYCSNFDSIRVRVGPGTVYSIIGLLRANDCFPFDARSSSGLWMRIAENQGVYSGGWVSSDQLRANKINELATITPEPNLLGCVVTGYQPLFVRDGPSIDYNRMKSFLSDGNCLRFDARNKEGSWVRIKENQDDFSEFGNGWVNSKFIFPYDFDDQGEWTIELFYRLPIVN